MQGVWHALNRQDWSSDVAPLAAALAEKARPCTKPPLRCLSFAVAAFERCRNATLLGLHQVVVLTSSVLFKASEPSSLAHDAFHTLFLSPLTG